MNRKIKFRGKCSQSGEWIYGDLIHGVGSKRDNVYILPYIVNVAYVKYCDPVDGVIVDHKTVGQFTGVTDINLKEIYEGDTCLCFKDGNPIGANEVIEFRNAAFWLRHRNYSMYNWLNYTSRDGDYFNGEFEIIGNIYENPELLNIKP